MVAVAPIGFQSPLDEAVPRSPTDLSWKSATAGNDAGVLITLDSEANAECRFESGPVSFSFTLDEVWQQGAVIANAGGVNRRVEVAPCPVGGSLQAALHYRDTQPASGWCPYWIHVVQADREQAWSSPVYVTRD